MQHLPLPLTILLACCLFGCSPDPLPPAEPDPMPVDSLAQDSAITYSYLALGDSYTIGESVSEAERWPVQLTDSLRAAGLDMTDPLIIARTGWSTQQLQAAIAQQGLTDTFSLVSLLIGVNNQFRGYPEAQYRTGFADLLQTARAYAGGQAGRVFVLSIPDYGVTPFGQNRDTVRIARELDRYNAIADSICATQGVAFFYITPISREARAEPALLASDRLHPSGLMYTRWVALIRPAVQALLER